MPEVVRHVLIVPIIAILVACGPSNAGNVDADVYAGDVCSALLAWRQGVTNDSSELSRALGAAADTATVRARYTTFFAAAVRRTDALVTAVGRAGAPKAEGGNGYARDLATTLATTTTALRRARSRFAALPTADLASYAAGAAKIRDELGSAFAGIGRSLDRLAESYPDDELNAAFAEQPACQSLT